MKKFLCFIITCFITIQNVYAENKKKQEYVKYDSDINKYLCCYEKKIINSSYAKTPKEFAEGIISNLQLFENNKEGKNIGSSICIIHVLDNGNLTFTFFSDEELQKFHEETDYILNKYYGGYDITSFQNSSKYTQTHVTTMILKRIKKKNKFKLKY